jgi:hypothetical protein
MVIIRPNLSDETPVRFKLVAGEGSALIEFKPK